MRYGTIEAMLGQTITSIEKTEESLTFYTADGTRFKMYHSQDCCEHVYIEDIAGDLEDLKGSPIVRAEEPSTLDGFVEPQPTYSDGSETWTFYILGTAKGTVTIRWLGSSNGYYSESVEVVEIPGPGLPHKSDASLN